MGELMDWELWREIANFKGTLDIGGPEFKVRPVSCCFVLFFPSHSQLSECRCKLGSLLDLTRLVSLLNRCEQVIEAQEVK